MPDSPSPAARDAHPGSAEEVPEGRRDEVLVLETPERNAAFKEAMAKLSPKERKAYDLFGSVIAHQNQREKDESRRRLQDETFLINEAATRLTGFSVLSPGDDRRLLIRYHLEEFFSALPMPPGLDASVKAALRREALTMLLKLGPQDDIERMLLSQLIATHMASMACFASAAAPDVSPERAAQALFQGQKMSRLFLDLERSFRQRRKQLGRPDAGEPDADPKHMAHILLRLCETEGIRFDDDDTTP